MEAQRDQKVIKESLKTTKNLMPYNFTNLKQDPYKSRIHQKSITRKCHQSRHKNADTKASAIHLNNAWSMEKPARDVER